MLLEIKRNLILFFILLTFVIFGLPIVDRVEIIAISIFFLILFSIEEIKPKINLGLILLLLSLTFFFKFINEKSIKETHGIYLPNDKNEKLYQKNYKNFFNVIEKIFFEKYPKEHLECLSSDINCWKDYKFENYYSQSFDNGFFSQEGISRSIKNINHNSLSSLRIGNINNKNLDFYNSNNENLISRSKAPYYVIYDFSQYQKKGSKICSSNNAVILNNNETIHKKEGGCYNIDKKTLIGFFSFNENLSVYIKKNKIDVFLKYFEFFLKLLFFSIVLLIITLRINKKKLLSLSILFSLSNIVYFLFISSKPEYNFGYYPLQGGMDGLVHEGFGRSITNYFFNLNIYELFRGGENIYYFMPGMRYFSFFEKFLFGDTFNGIYLICVFTPIVFYIFLNVLGVNSSFSLFISIIFILLKIDHLGFSYDFLLKMSSSYYPEGIAILCFMFSIIFLRKNLLIYSSIFIFFMVFLRPNYLPVYCIFCIAAYVNFFKNNEFKNIFLFSIGTSLILIFPMHNFFFSNGQLVILTNSMMIKENLIINPFTYLDFLRSYNNGDIIINHLYGLFTANNKKIEILFINSFLLLNLFYFFLIKKNYYLKFYAIIITAQLAPMLFYSSAIRYSYFPWFLVTVSNILIVNNLIFKKK